MPRNQGAIACVFALSAIIADPATSQEVATTYDDEWISLSGQVETVLSNGFVLDYGENDITVELDKLDWSVDRSALQDTQVTVTGRMDRNLYKTRSIEAAVVYIPSRNEYLYADPADEEGDPSLTRSFVPGLFEGAEDGQWMSFSGRVTGIEGDEILVDTGESTVRVDTSLLPGALDSPEVAVGDRVLVTGEMDAAGFFDRREVEANSVTKLTNVGY